MEKKIATENFITKAKQVHGDKYDYSKVEYVNSKEKVCIICPEHGEFWQTPNSHLSSHGCPKCKIDKCKHDLSKTNDQFKKELLEIFGNKYILDEIKYVNAHTKVDIICPEHGKFSIKPNSLLNGHGCPKCGIIEGHKKQKNDNFIEMATNLFDGFYDYSKTNYKNRDTNVSVICPIHGEFMIRPSSHLNGHGCPKCSGKHHYTTEEWVNIAKTVHENKYIYDNTIYKNYYTKVNIVCPLHGSFWQFPSDHLKGCGCPKCNASKLENEMMHILEFNNIKYIHLAKKTDLPWLDRQSLDFYLPDYGIAIECQGKQHYVPVDFAGKGKEWAKRNFEYIKKLDSKKRKLCEENNVKLFYYNSENKNEITENIVCLRKR